MIEVPTLHIRNVPEDVYEAASRAARRERGTSMNTEVIEILDEAPCATNGGALTK